MQVQREIITACQRQSFVYKIEEDVWPVYHFHPEFDLLYFKKDQGRLIVGDHLGSFNKGDIIFLSPNVPHALHAQERKIITNDNAIYVIQFSVDSLGKDFLEKYELEGIKNFLESCNQGFKLKGETLKKTRILMEKADGLTPLKQLGILLEILENFSENPQDIEAITSPVLNPIMKEDTASKINTIINHILENKHRHISLDEISDKLCMTSKSFCRFFKKNTGKNFVAYVNEIKIGEACKLLISTELTVSEICHESGFNNISNFNRRFLQLKGVSPKEYRNQGKMIN